MGHDETLELELSPHEFPKGERIIVESLKEFMVRSLSRRVRADSWIFVSILGILLHGPKPLHKTAQYLIALN
jgi:hypothetical protein